MTDCLSDKEIAAVKRGLKKDPSRFMLAYCDAAQYGDGPNRFLVFDTFEGMTRYYFRMVEKEQAGEICDLCAGPILLPGKRFRGLPGLLVTTEAQYDWCAKREAIAEVLINAEALAASEAIEAGKAADNE